MDGDKFIEWLRQQYDEAVQEKRPELVWCLNTKDKEDFVLCLDGMTLEQMEDTLEQMEDDIKKKEIPLLIMRRIYTNRPFDEQVMDL